LAIKDDGGVEKWSRQWICFSHMVGMVLTRIQISLVRPKRIYRCGTKENIREQPV